MSQNSDTDNLNDGNHTEKTPFERSRFGGSIKSPKVKSEIPVSKSDLGKGAQKLWQNKTTQINWSV